MDIPRPSRRAIEKLRVVLEGCGYNTDLFIIEEGVL
jgi:hypothetical protein